MRQGASLQPHPHLRKPLCLAPAGAAGLAVLAFAFASEAGGAAWRQAALLLVVAPLLEETVFRAGMQEWLRRATRRPVAAIALTAALFGLAHVAVRGELAAALVFVPALAIGFVYERTGRLRDCVLLHAAMNTLWLAGIGFS